MDNRRCFKVFYCRRAWLRVGKVQAGVQIYQYNKGMLHAKLMIIDEEIAEVGAANYDMRSFRLNYE
ncbi:phospholipase D-like domain-containing protein, partial [Cytobacillus firmus]|uniref:phospholipase D-like domain-containing protein n=1 Tax=Cytobacillus firmus TaxID=1399 RepID=UPI00228746E3